MQFLLFDVGATLVFLVGYLTVATLQRRRALAVPTGTSRRLSLESRPAAYPEGSKPGEPGNEAPAARRPRRKWPRLSHPR